MTHLRTILCRAPIPAAEPTPMPEAKPAADIIADFTRDVIADIARALSTPVFAPGRCCCPQPDSPWDATWGYYGQCGTCGRPRLDRDEDTYVRSAIRDDTP